MENLRLPRRGLTRKEAAHWVGVGVSKFDEMVRDGRMPSPRVIDRRRVFDAYEVDEAFDALPHEGDQEESPNPWLEGENAA